MIGSNSLWIEMVTPGFRSTQVKFWSQHPASVIITYSRGVNYRNEQLEVDLIGSPLLTQESSKNKEPHIFSASRHGNVHAAAPGHE